MACDAKGLQAAIRRVVVQRPRSPRDVVAALEDAETSRFDILTHLLMLVNAGVVYIQPDGLLKTAQFRCEHCGCNPCNCDT